MTNIDINSDIAEGFGAYRCGDDNAMLAIVTSANVACGFHAGDPEIMARTFKIAKQRGVSVGAHPGFPDLWGFGRRRIPFSTGEIERLIAYQLGSAQALATYSGHRIGYVKTHGALANIAETDADVAGAIAHAVHSVDRSLAFLTIALSQQEKSAAAAGLRAIAEIYADRGYDEDGHLIPRNRPGAMIEDPDEAAGRMLEMIEAGAIITSSGKRLPTGIDSVCVHGDSAHGIKIARCVRERLEAAGLTIAAFAR
jgi:UPF0271 protein